MTTDLMFVIGSGLALFLVGTNTAFLFHLHSSLTKWFTFKVLAVDLLCVYVALSLAFGNPDTWRAIIAVVALSVDIIALFWMWAGIVKLQEKGIIGLIPLGRTVSVELPPGLNNGPEDD